MLYKILDFLKGGPGMVLSLVITIVLSFYFVRTERQRSTPTATTPKLKQVDLVSSAELETPVQVDRRDRFLPFHPLPEKPVIIERSSTTTLQPSLLLAQTTQTQELGTIKLIHSFVAMPSPAGDITNDPVIANEAAVSPGSILVGTLIPCRTIHEVIAGQQASMIAAVITNDVRRSNGRLLRAGSVIYGTTGIVQDSRLHADQSWQLPTETIKASMIERHHDKDTGRFSYGASGISGTRLDRPYKNTGKIFLASAISALARSFRSTSATVFGDVPRHGLGNAGIEAGAAVIDQHTQYLQEQTRSANHPRLFIAQGAEFYLYVR